MNTPKKILVIRNDKLGDFMLAWPAFSLLKTQYPNAEITALVPEYTAPLAEQCEWIDKVLIDKKEKSFIKDVLSLTKKIKTNHYDASISLFSEARTAASLWLAGVKIRIGPATKLAQIFLNKKLKQKRSQSKKPEYEYNIDLIKHYIKLNNQVPRIPQNAPFMTFDKAETQLIKNNLLNERSISNNVKLIIIHPGTGGSAINLPLKNYAELANCIAEHKNVYFIITAGPNELTNAKNLSKLLNTAHHIHYSKGNIVEFCKLISITDIFISGSTGPLHIAGALNKRTAAFYPSKKSATSLRWQTINAKNNQLLFTLGNDENKNSSVTDIEPICHEINKKYFHVTK